ncbi:virion structural protein [Dinoroseobacter phage DS-1410Ws-06]|uniref:Virion protein n=1 Tax=Dinoroseobacter phage DS-1410Ws-06 TaxID=1815983 RepID=A0A191VYE4_9CAUD|nr:virion structural protein [Dinoroseobacter phage DS-1410Ws-06]ANJ20728.1 virion protein [Dinoroseobacter phage DS-1410Ws-06]
MIVTFTEFTTKLAHGQLKNTALVDDSDTGEINPGHEDQILELTNQGLTDIFTKKKLLESRAVLTLTPGTNIYTLDTAPAADYEDMVRVLQVEAVMNGYELIERNKRVFTPKGGLHVTSPSEYSLRFSQWFMDTYQPYVDVVFQKKHPIVELGGSIDIPAHMYEALVLYVSGLYLSHMGGDQNKADGDSYYGLYLKMMSDDEMNNTSGTSEVTDDDTRFQDRGFV